MDTQEQEIIKNQQQFFTSGTTKSILFRKEQLKKLKQAIINHEQEILDALHSDLGKPAFSAYLSEIYYCVQEINIYLKNLASWARPQRVKTSWLLFPAHSYIIQEPLGVTLIIAPWNYPFQLTFMPLIGSIAAGNCTIIKPSEVAPACSRVLAHIIQKTFDPAYITVIQGDAMTAQALLQEKFDYIFFTGGTEIGKKVMTAAAQHLTPLTLELGGKNPCIVTHDAPLDITAKRIIRAKFSNLGQSCIAPNYILVDAIIKQDLILELKKQLTNDVEHAGKIINQKHFERLTRMLQNCTIVTGGVTDASKLIIQPTIIDGVSKDHPSMQEEIFGPILPVISYETVDQAIKFINTDHKPLALYIFSQDKQVQQKILQQTSSGGVCINDVGLQVANSNLPFGGVEFSGFGAYHGKKTFETFSHGKPVACNSFWFDFSLKYPSSAWAKRLVKKLLNFFNFF